MPPRTNADLKQFLPYVEHCDLTEEEKLALLADLWSIMSTFVDEAWGLCPVRQAANDNKRISGVKPLKNIYSMHADNSNEPPTAEPVKRQR